MDNEEERMIWTEHLSKSYGEKEAVLSLIHISEPTRPY